MKVVVAIAAVFVALVAIWFFKADSRKSSEVTVDIKVSPKVSVYPKEGSVVFVVSDEGRILPKGLEVSITLSTLAGPYRTVAQSTGEDFRLEIPYTRAGETPYTVRMGQEIVEGHFSIHPGPPVTPLTLSIGPRATRVGSHTWMSVVVHPLDKYKNVSDRPLEIHATYPDGKGWSNQLEVSRLFTWGILPTSKETGTLEVVAQSGNALAEAGEIDILPGNISKLDFNALQPTTSADLRDTWQFQISNAVDAFGHGVSDGQSVVFMGQGEGLNFFATRPLIQGRDDMVLPSYGHPGSYFMNLLASGFRSDPLEFRTESLSDLKVHLAWSSTDPLIAHLGAVVTTSGAMVDDGTMVQIDVFNEKQKTLTFFSTVQNGELFWSVPSVPKESTHLEIEVSGLRKRLALPPRAP